MYSEEIFTICSFQYWKRKSHLPLSSLKNLKDWQEEEVKVWGEAGRVVGEARGSLTHHSFLAQSPLPALEASSAELTKFLHFTPNTMGVTYTKLNT